MGAEGSAAFVTPLTEKTPLAFDGHTDYAAYRQDVQLWLQLTTLTSARQGTVLIGRLSGEAKASAKTLSMETLIADTGVTAILEHLDKSYGLDTTDQLYIDLAAFLDYSWNGRMSVEQFIAGFNARIDKISELQINEKL